MDGTRPVLVLWRAFLRQFFTSESATSDIQLRQTAIWVLAFLVTPGVFLVFAMMPAYTIAVLIGNLVLAEAIITLLGSVFVTFSMVAIGLIAVFAWDGLSFDLRDAIVLGPLPLDGRTIIAAKLGALATFVLGTSAAVNLVTALPFALVTADHPGGGGFLGHLVAHLVATMGAACFVFAVIVTLRGTIVLVCGARVAARLGSLLQFVFVSALLCLVILVPALSPAQARLVDSVPAAWVPPTWFLGLFERQMGLGDAGSMVLARRALLALIFAVAGAVLVSVAGFRRQMQVALSPSASAGVFGTPRLGRRVARWLVGRRPAARATVDFIFLTIARNRIQQAPIAMNAAFGVAIVAAALSRRADGLESLMRPRTLVLWIPLVLAYWTAVGLRASFFVPSELAASWVFRMNAPEGTPAYWAAVRASTFGFLVAPALAVNCLIVVPLLGWRLAGWHGLVVALMVAILAQAVALTVDFVPFTRAYRPGHARLKTRWPLYLAGTFAFAYVPVRVELRMVDGSMLELVAWLAMAVLALEVLGRRTATRWVVDAGPETGEAPWESTVLDLSAGGAVGFGSERQARTSP